MNLITAFLQEAKPVIELLNLQKVEVPSPFKLYKGEIHNLVISGPGEENTTQAVSFLHGHLPSLFTPWLNIGLAGHGSENIGNALQVVKCIDENSGRSTFPPQLYTSIFPKTILKTVQHPSNEYLSGHAYDMEGFSFFQTATRFSTNELVQSVKIISDNPGKPFSEFSKSETESLISPHLPNLLLLIEEMEKSSKSLQPKQEFIQLFQNLISLFSYSETQIFQLKKHLHHAFAIGIKTDSILKIAQESSDSRNFLSTFLMELDSKRLFS